MRTSDLLLEITQKWRNKALYKDINIIGDVVTISFAAEPFDTPNDDSILINYVLQKGFYIRLVQPLIERLSNV